MIGVNVFNLINQTMNTSVQYYFAKDGQRIGLYSENHIFNFISSGQIQKQTMVWIQDMPSWMPAEQVIYVNKLFALVPKPIKL
jgi:hypothetical protein